MKELQNIPFSEENSARVEPSEHEFSEESAENTAEHERPAPVGFFESVFEEIGDQPQTKKTKRSLPWWCSIVAWILLWMTVAVCAAFVTFYGIMFQDVKCKKWISSLMISFFTSAFVTQPVKILLVALFIALLFKKPHDEDEDELSNEDEEEYVLQMDEQWLHSTSNRGI